MYKKHILYIFCTSANDVLTMYTTDIHFERMYRKSIPEVYILYTHFFVTVLGKTLMKMSPPSLGKFDVEDGVKLVGIVALSDFMKDYLIKQKIIPNNI